MSGWAGVSPTSTPSGRSWAGPRLCLRNVIVYLTDNVSGRTSDFAQLLGLKDARVRALLGELIAEGIVVQEGGRRYRVYKLKA